MEKRPRLRETLTNNAVYMDDVMAGYTIEGNIFIDVVCHTLPESASWFLACVPACLSARPPARPPACMPACVRAQLSSVGTHGQFLC